MQAPRYPPREVPRICRSPTGALSILSAVHDRTARCGRMQPCTGHERLASGPTLAPGAALQAIEDVCQSLIVLAVHKVEVDPRIGERATEAEDQREFLRGELVTIFLE